MESCELTLGRDLGASGCAGTILPVILRDLGGGRSSVCHIQDMKEAGGPRVPPAIHT